MGGQSGWARENPGTPHFRGEPGAMIHRRMRVFGGPFIMEPRLSSVDTNLYLTKCFPKISFNFLTYEWDREP